MIDTKEIINKLINLDRKKQQYILGWLSPRYLATIMKKCTDRQRQKLAENMSMGKRERINDELRTNPRELEKPVLVKAVFSTLLQAISSDVYNNSMNDRSYKKRRK